jgi:hypothetical protein
MYYAGIGSRKTPIEIRKFMTKIASKLESLGWTLRSGAAPGADWAFERGVKNEVMKEIYLPWAGFNDSRSTLHDLPLDRMAKDIAEPHHPTWNYLKKQTKDLMGRNVYQILGAHLDKPVKFVICYTEDGCESKEDRSLETGGTGLAISLADSLGIPVFNLKNEDSRKRLQSFIEKT